MRTFLTFMCVVLSAFILAAVCFYGSSSFTTMKNYTAAEEGMWELNISSWIQNEEQYEIARNHAVVDDYLYVRSENVYVDAENSDDERVKYFEITDGKNSWRTRTLFSEKENGNPKLSGRGLVQYRNYTDDGAVVPYFLKEAGYSEGDTVTLSVRPADAAYDDGSALIKEIRNKISERQKEKKNYSGSVKSELSLRGTDIDDYPLAGIKYGEPEEITFRIAGFAAAGTKGDFISRGSTDISFRELAEKNPDLDFNEDPHFFIRLSDSCDFDEAVRLLFTDLGYDQKDFYDLQPETNDLLLALEVKSPNAMVKVIIIIVPVSIVILIAWFISRFVIDNTFEMAVKERSMHFAELRVIGASKGQIAAIVLTEALFYCLTAVPAGILLALILCRIMFTAISRSGLEMFEFSAYPLFVVLSAFLSVSAVFISAYTSAMWAARKLSPAEALNFGKPSRRKNVRRKKTKLYTGFKRFLLKYTKKNIMAVKSRFVISTVTMALGILMFTLTTLTLLSFRTFYAKFEDSMPGYDFEINELYVPDTEYLQTVSEELRRDEVFSEFRTEGSEIICFSSDSVSDPGGAVQFEVHGAHAYGELQFINEEQYRFYELDKTTGISYADFSEKKMVFYNKSVYGSGSELEFGFTAPKIKYEKEFKRFKEDVTLTLSENNILNVSGTVRTTYWYNPNAFFISLENVDEYSSGTPDYKVWLTVNGREHYDEALECVKSFEKTTGAEFTNLYRFNTGFELFLKAIIKSVLIFLVSVWVTGILSMINSVNTSVLNRSTELMMLRSLGMTEKQLRESVLLETVMFSSAAAVTGTGAGTLLFTGVSNMVVTVYSEPLPEITGMVIAVIAVTLVINVLIALLSALPAVKALGRIENIARTE